MRPLFLLMADPTRLELATSAVTGQRSNQLSYESSLLNYNVLVGKMQYYKTIPPSIHYYTYAKMSSLHTWNLEGAWVSNLRCVDLVLHGRLWAKRSRLGSHGGSSWLNRSNRFSESGWSLWSRSSRIHINRRSRRCTRAACAFLLWRPFRKPWN